MYIDELKTIAQIIDFGNKKFSKADLFFYHGTDNAYDEACLLVAYILNVDLLTGCLSMEQVLTLQQRKEIIDIFQYRIDKKIPVPYITNTAYFAGRKFYIDERAMIPTSPFAEIIINNFSPWISTRPKNILDLCTGSCALAISIAYQFSDCLIDAIDISEDALSVAKKNVELHSLQKKVELRKSDLFSNIDKKYDLIVSNPPYVGYQEYKRLAKEFYYEPKLAFVAEKNGLSIVERILKKSSKFLNDNGVIFIEVGSYAKNLEKKFSYIPFTWVELYNGGEGILIMTKKELEDYF